MEWESLIESDLCGAVSLLAFGVSAAYLVYRRTPQVIARFRPGMDSLQGAADWLRRQGEAKHEQATVSDVDRQALESDEATGGMQVTILRRWGWKDTAAAGAAVVSACPAVACGIPYLYRVITQWAG